MSRYIDCTGWHYIGGVDQFDVFFVPRRIGWRVCWGMRPGHAALFVEVPQPELLLSKLNDPAAAPYNVITPEQAERIFLLIKLFGPQEEV